MGSKNEPPYRVGESWEDFLASRGIDRDKAEPIHEIQWLRSERIRLMVEVKRHRMTEEEREAANCCAVRLGGLCIGGVLMAYLERTAPLAAS